MLGRQGSWRAAGMLGLPVWGWEGLGQPSVQLQLWLWLWLCGRGRGGRRRRRWRTSKRMRKRRKCCFCGMWVAPPCGQGQLCGPRRPPPRLLRGQLRASPRAAVWRRVAGGARLQPGGPVGRSDWQRWAAEARGCGVRLPDLAWLGSCYV